MKKIVLSAMALVLTMVLMACGEITHSNLPKDEIEITQTVTTGGKKQTITSTFTTNPSVVATFALEVADIFLSLGFEKSGITLFGLAKGANLNASLSAFADDKYPNVGTLFVPNLDTLNLMMPDLIILGGRASSEYDALKEKYPNADILDVSNANPYFFETQKVVYNNLGKIFTNYTEDLNEEIASFENSFNQIKLNFPNKRVQFLMVNGDEISDFGVGSRFGFIYSELGLTAADQDGVILEAHGKTVNAEYISKVNPEIILIFDRTMATAGISGSINNIIANELVKGTVAGQNEAIYILNANAWYILPGGIASTNQMIADLNKVLA